MNILPIFLLERIGEGEEHTQKEQHIDAQPPALELHGLTHIGEKIRQVTDHPVVFLRRQATRLRQLEAFQRTLVLALGLRIDGLLQPLLTRQDMGHAHIGKYPIVHAVRPALVHIETLEIGEDPIRATPAGDQRQIRHLGAEPLLAVLRAHGADHQIAGLGLRVEDEVLTHLNLVEPEVLAHTIVAHVLEGMAAHAVIDKVLGAPVQGFLVRKIDIGVFQVQTTAAGGRDEHGRQQEHGCDQQSFHFVTLSGTDVVLSSLL